MKTPFTVESIEGCEPALENINKVLDYKANFDDRDKLILALLNHEFIKAHNVTVPKEMFHNNLFVIGWLAVIISPEFLKYKIALEKFKLSDYTDEAILNAYDRVTQAMLKHPIPPRPKDI